MANFKVLQATNVKFVESIQARRIRVELSIADKKSEGKKSRRGKGNEEMQKILQGAKFWHPAKVASTFVILFCPF